MFYFLLALTAVLAATANAGPVLDGSGKPIINGSYYAFSNYRQIQDGGLNLSPRGGDECPLYIEQEVSFGKWGIPIRFSNWKSGAAYVPELESLNIEMDNNSTTCAPSTYWSVRTMDESEFRTGLVAVGPEPKPGEDSSRSFFQLKRIEERVSEYDIKYAIMFCRKENSCSNLELIEDEDGAVRLGLGAFPSPFGFMKVQTSSKTISTM